MCLLGIETCFTGVSVSLKDHKVLETKQVTKEKGQSENLAVLVKNILKENKKSFSDITDIYASAGPGSFTGIRIGLSFIEGVTFSLPFIKKHYVSSFACVLSKMRYNPLKEDTICVILKAIGETFYIQFFNADFFSLSSPLYVSLEEAKKLVSSRICKLYGNFNGFFKDFEVIESNAEVNSVGAVLCSKFSQLCSPDYKPIYIREVL